jgi:hypothetical protein
VVLVKQPYTLNDVKKDLEKIQAGVARIENEFYSKLQTLRDSSDAKKVFTRLTRTVTNGTPVELIIRKVKE